MNVHVVVQQVLFDIAMKIVDCFRIWFICRPTGYRSLIRILMFLEDSALNTVTSRSTFVLLPAHIPVNTEEFAVQ